MPIAKYVYICIATYFLLSNGEQISVAERKNNKAGADNLEDLKKKWRFV